MDNYIVSARKYRPQTFDSVIGQKALTTTLKNAIATGKLAHAYLFCGPRGVGKTTCARIFAKTINCLNPRPDGEACEECESCRAFNEGRSLSIHELDAASNNSVDDIRQLIEQVSVPPQVGRYKVFIIDEVHMLSQSAFNAFLKTLEEPPAHVIFILATTEKHKILPTILSRCQIYDFNRMETDDIVGHLRNVAQNEGVQFEEEALGVIAQKADGGMRDALSIFDQVVSFTGGNLTYDKVIENLNVLDYDYYFRTTAQLLSGDVAGVMLTLNEIITKGFPPNQFVGGLASHLRNLLVSRDEQTLPLLEVSQAVRGRYAEQAKLCSPRFLFRAVRILNDCDLNYRQSRNKRLLVELALIRAAQAEDDPPGGLGPTSELKPIFQAAASNGTPAPATTQAPPAATPTTATATPPAAATPTPSAATPAAHPAPASATPATAVRPSSPTPPAGHRPLHKRTVSIMGQPAAQAETPQPAVEPKASYGNKTFTQADVNYQWLRYVGSLPQEQAATAGRMKNMQPSLAADGSNQIEVAVDNALVVKDLEAIKGDLTNYLRRELDNGNINVAFRLIQANEQHRAYGKRELFAEMLKKNPQLQPLAKELQLELA